MEHCITASEFALLLTVFWLPVFAVAAFPQWRLLIATRRRFAWLLAILLLESALAFAIWLSPLHQYFFSLGDLGSGFSIGSIPFQAAVLAAVAVTFFVWVVCRRVPRPAP
jgi:hypothetical protein